MMMMMMMNMIVMMNGIMMMMMMMMMMMVVVMLMIMMIKIKISGVQSIIIIIIIKTWETQKFRESLEGLLLWLNAHASLCKSAPCLLIHICTVLRLFKRHLNTTS